LLKLPGTWLRQPKSALPAKRTRLVRTNYFSETDHHSGESRKRHSVERLIAIPAKAESSFRRTPESKMLSPAGVSLIDIARLCHAAFAGVTTSAQQSQTTRELIVITRFTSLLTTGI
jgi:hypothetical protein